MLEQSEIAGLKDRLLAEREFLRNQLAKIEAGNASSVQDYTGENDYDEDFPDLATAVFEREKDFSIEWNIRDILGQIDEALQRIEAGTYGICVVCGQPIGDERLKALPYTSLCVKDKEREERTR